MNRKKCEKICYEKKVEIKRENDKCEEDKEIRNLRKEISDTKLRIKSN